MTGAKTGVALEVETAQLFDLPIGHNPFILHDVAAVGHGERQARVLLHEQHRRADFVSRREDN